MEGKMANANTLELLSIKEVADRLSVSERTLRNWRQAGGHALMNLKAIRVGGPGGPLRWRSEDVDGFIASLAYEAS
ncbi:DNA-binding protein [Corynebacterium diphtheriae]|nr:hypothetical protein CDC7B_1069 [Corynebacterium diphtheriae C7 (beta)]OSQ19985.1 DNA-binding protein [Corynebacterium diphtheriae]RKW91702.1 DNA-binding protein [Corynebacterium diphtheriae]RKX01489.1 DNA-binding protein [Corynebacterium diphtheriae]RLP09448.1 DNA-binding protein [Corynebacterium diphtheriae]